MKKVRRSCVLLAFSFIGVFLCAAPQSPATTGPTEGAWQVLEGALKTGNPDEQEAAVVVLFSWPRSRPQSN